MEHEPRLNEISHALDVLVVDDDPAIASILRDLLEAEALRVAVAHDGLDGLRISRTSPPRLVLTDLMMPRMSGEELASALRESFGSATPRIVYMSAAKQPPRDGQPFVRKPFDLGDILATVCEELGRAPAPRFN